MLREWLVIPKADAYIFPDREICHVVQGAKVNGGDTYHGHELSLDCDCRPRIEETLDVLIVIHRYDA